MPLISPRRASFSANLPERNKRGTWANRHLGFVGGRVQGWADGLHTAACTAGPPA